MYIARGGVGGEGVDKDEVVLEDSDFFVGRVVGLPEVGLLAVSAEICHRGRKRNAKSFQTRTYPSDRRNYASQTSTNLY